MGRATSTVGFVYFIQPVGGGPIKIGWAYDPERRRSELQCGSPLVLRIIGAAEGSQAMERKIHKRLKHLREHGEWFKPTVELKDVMLEFGAGARMDKFEKQREPVFGQANLARNGACPNCGCRLAKRGWNADFVCLACFEIQVMREAGIDPFDCTDEEAQRAKRLMREREREYEDRHYAA